MTRSEIEFGFVIKGYPGTGRRVENESDLSRVYSPDLVQGAFMGDMVLRIGDEDFTTTFGWMTLIDWCMRLTHLINSLSAPNCREVVRFSESDDFISCRCYQDSIFLASSYRPGIGVANRSAFAELGLEFVATKMNWIASSFPGAMKNPAMADVVGRLGWRPN